VPSWRDTATRPGLAAWSCRSRQPRRVRRVAAQFPLAAVRF
jgi:hypothetical protein